ncbi:DUF2335 domain-containing protein [Pseudomonas cichorii]|uniref:DUF2335 domain-containing protein n=1 Tax=Pseudomonas cichorii TaxID=36746 RepID=A0ABQ1DT23_PSECI|nr:DUF2335 domain-containing protein [Pseudomonas cichorii]QVE17972.1 DUF2335 domain-containing protein [Pseudomonas cichorii]GFM68686.1 hypothetical protein PSCICJ_48040 [Pseudomonas cichorii]GFM94175.1 hypothetical protein PSCICP_41470 [Pseudomonas cichorii]
MKSLKSGDELTAEQHSILENVLSAAAKKEPEMVAQIAFQQEVYAGPLPHPDQLNNYDEHTRRLIVEMAVREQAHYHHMQSKSLSGAIWKDRIGQTFGFGIALAGLGAAAWIAQYSAVAAAIIGTLDLLGMVGIFVVPRAFEQRAAARSEQPSPPKKRAARKR